MSVKAVSQNLVCKDKIIKDIFCFIIYNQNIIYLVRRSAGHASKDQLIYYVKSFCDFFFAFFLNILQLIPTTKLICLKKKTRG